MGHFRRFDDVQVTSARFPLATGKRPSQDISNVRGEMNQTSAPIRFKAVVLLVRRDRSVTTHGEDDNITTAQRSRSPGARAFGPCSRPTIQKFPGFFFHSDQVIVGSSGNRVKILFSPDCFNFLFSSHAVPPNTQTAL